MTIGVRPAASARASVLLACTAAAASLRSAVGGARVAESIPAAMVFGAVLIATAYGAGWRCGRPDPRSLLAGSVGAVVLVAMPAAVRGVPLMWHVGSLPSGWMLWGPALVLVVAGEEVVLRGVLFDAIVAGHGVAAAVMVTSAAFGVMHVPLYGWGAVPLDVAVGVWLAGLRLVSNGIAAPAVGHLVADTATLWLL